MHRAQILLEPWQYEMLKAQSEREGRSISEIVRELLTRVLRGPEGSASRLDDIEGLVADPGMSARDHDVLLYRRGRSKRR